MSILSSNREAGSLPHEQETGTMNSEQKYELQKVYEALQAVEDRMDTLAEQEALELHFATVENREPELFAIYMGMAQLKERAEALRQQL